MPSQFRRELFWLCLGTVGALLIGLLLQRPVIVLVVFLFGYSVWLLVRIDKIVGWLQTGSKRSAAPPTVGLMNQAVEYIQREKANSTKQKNRYRMALEQFNSLAAELPDATVVLDDNYQIRWANVAARTLLNISAERDTGQRLDNLIRQPEFQQYLRHPESTSELEMPSPLAPGDTLAIRVVPSGRKMSVLIARDVTQRVRVREMRKAFVGDVSHELRTPLTVIQGYLEMMRDDTSLLDAQRDILVNVSTQADRMEHIVEHLLELSKLEGNPLGEGEGDSIVVAEMLSSLVNALQSSMGQEHQFILLLDEELGLLGSETEVYSACNNLLTNAIKYTPAKTKITVVWHLDDFGDATLTVKDSGDGIEAHHLPRLSERFYRVDRGRSRRQGGTGLGLAIVKHVAQRHGGQLLIDSRYGDGSEFTIQFPASRAIDLKRAMAL